MRYLVIAITIIMAFTTISRTARADMVGAAAGAAQSTTHAAITTATTARNNDIGPLPQSGSAKHSLSGVTASAKAPAAWRCWPRSDAGCALGGALWKACTIRVDSH